MFETRKVNLFIRFIGTNEPVYKTEHCTGETTIKQLIKQSGLTTKAAKIHIEGKIINEKEYELPLNSFKSSGVVFMSIIYGEGVN